MKMACLRGILVLVHCLLRACSLAAPVTTGFYCRLGGSSSAHEMVQTRHKALQNLASALLSALQIASFASNNGRHSHNH